MSWSESYKRTHSKCRHFYQALSLINYHLSRSSLVDKVLPSVLDTGLKVFEATLGKEDLRNYEMWVIAVNTWYSLYWTTIANFEEPANGMGLPNSNFYEITCGGPVFISSQLFLHLFVTAYTFALVNKDPNPPPALASKTQTNNIILMIKRED